MNSFFQFNRFGRVLAKDLKEYYSKFGLSLLFFCGLYLLIVLLFIIFTGSYALNPVSRLDVIYFLGYIAIAIVSPFKLYGTINLEGQGVSFALLPASYCEKFISMLINCIIVTPIVFFLLMFLTDTIVACIIPPMPQILDTLKTFRWDILLELVAIETFFIFGNVLFRKNKVLLTVISSLVLLLILSTIATSCMLANFYEFTVSADDYANFKTLINTDAEKIFPESFKTIISVCSYIVPVLLLAGSYFRLKTQKY